LRHAVVEDDLQAVTADGLPWEHLRSSSVLVTGANGLLAAYMAESLLYLNESRSLGIKVRAMVRNRARAETRFAAYRGRRDFELIEQDLGAALAPITGDVDVVIHAASQASPKSYDVDPVGTLVPNVLGTAALLALARERACRGFLYFSSGEIYGAVDPAKQPYAEDEYGRVDPMAVRSCYAEGKRAGEALVAAWHHQHGVPAKVVRPFHTYGPGLRLDDGRVYADFIADVLAGRDIVMKSDGAAVRAFCYLADATRGFFTVLLLGRSGEAYNVANDEAQCSIVELAERLVNLAPEKGLRVVRKARASDDRYMPSPVARTWPSTAKVRALGWRPVTGIDEGFSRTLRSFT
jgi:nucleoside-diphosphate-sugar epimerase